MTCFDLDFVARNIIVSFAGESALSVFRNYRIVGEVGSEPNGFCPSPYQDASVQITEYTHEGSVFDGQLPFYVMFN